MRQVVFQLFSDVGPCYCNSCRSLTTVVSHHGFHCIKIIADIVHGADTIMSYISKWNNKYDMNDNNLHYYRSVYAIYKRPSLYPEAGLKIDRGVKEIMNHLIGLKEISNNWLGWKKSGTIWFGWKKSSNLWLKVMKINLSVVAKSILSYNNWDNIC